MRNLNSLQLLQKIPRNAMNPNLYMYSSLTKTPTQTPPNALLFNYLIQTLNFPKARAQSFSNSTRYSNVKSLEKPHSVIHYLRSIGFSETDIQSSARLDLRILFCNVDKNLKPKMDFFQDMGLVGSDLGKFISNHCNVLNYSLEKTLIPCIQILRKILVNDNKNNKDLIRLISRCSWLIQSNPERSLLSNIAFLESCGIVGSQLSGLLKVRPRLFIHDESKLRDLVSRVSDLGFSVTSRMFVHGLISVGGISKETFERKLKLFTSFGFTEHEFMEMFHKQPMMLSRSEEQLKLGIDFFLSKSELKKEALIRRPCCLCFSPADRLIPRYKVMQILKSKRLLKKEPSFVHVVALSEEKFLDSNYNSKLKLRALLSSNFLYNLTILFLTYFFGFTHILPLLHCSLLKLFFLDLEFDLIHHPLFFSLYKH
ncbi:hypothetical protein LWI29_005849 [Acer saccharum]|uniref:Uncharacterized protein n=1 Tax=Acer saccharum TaxID=4024 RepID=A0AA39SA70_ACESA|nr:hypothetical protein LWI29_005849 [Acer saccharum]